MSFASDLRSLIHIPGSCSYKFNRAIMMKTGFLSLTLCVPLSLLLLAMPCAQSASLVFTANLSGAAENPPVASPGTGFTTVTYDSLLRTLRVEVTFSDLLGATTVAHIHAPVEAPGNIGVATQVPTFPGFPSGVTFGTYDQTFDMSDAASFNPAFLTNHGGGDPAAAEAALVAALLEGKAYLNIHTAHTPSGEIRGFLVRSVPEPGTGLASALVLLGLAGLTRLRPRSL
jgi:hypothetical protein